MAYNPDVTPANTPQPTKQYKSRGNFGNLNDHLKVRIRLCDKDGKLLETSDEQITAVGIDGELTIDNQYSSPFENSNPEQKLPTLMGQLQTGQWVDTLNSVMSSLGVEISGSAQDSLNALQGRSSFTKENSTQVYVSTAPVIIPMILYFEAWEDAKSEVEDQLDLLKQWSLAELLSDQSIIASVAENRSIESVFPSLIPPFVAMYYGGKRYAPMLIQNMSEPLVQPPKDRDGNRLHAQVQINLLSRNAWDKNNIPLLTQDF